MGEDNIQIGHDGSQSLRSSVFSLQSWLQQSELALGQDTLTDTALEGRLSSKPQESSAGVPDQVQRDQEQLLLLQVSLLKGIILAPCLQKGQRRERELQARQELHICY